MTSLKALKVRIKSVKSTQKITQAMKMVAASKLRKARTKLECSLPYFNNLKSITNNILPSVDFEEMNDFLKLALKGNSDKKYLIIITSSDRGLCGSFNVNIFKAAKKYIQDIEQLGKNYDIVTIGNKAFDHFKVSHKHKIFTSFSDITKQSLSFDTAKKIADELLNTVLQGAYDHIMIVYSNFKSILSQETHIKQLFPIDIAPNTALPDTAVSYEFEPSPSVILEKILYKNLISQIYHCLLENAASEQGSRMNAMDNATRNASEMINQLSLVYNRTRQSIITKELIEIISGAEAI
ncbi:ATP synthase F1 subunit gamma [Rickettsiales endosymbiont of Stachyamoeba lipophora]|uniref:ATP synthase F1 subunit gamma n=1 Tax=Rickettsiales endosymbiont of Stachyamoeba lipophora TaxID=2486578 RepID=UPI000F6537B6|nr:ATP synthase F1 subunit gamma [Rickettsiales endosymbiont of Stachyamoeba lipophora]AZL15688.1 ATP synthase F1 subunit gamma [Rickettsiales endosymbiont of Stachyamoeba lipophora]